MPNPRARARHSGFNKGFFARQRVRVGDTGMRREIGQFLVCLGGLADLARRFRVGTPGLCCGIARAGQIGLRS